ncbi:ATP-dependent endonuclease [Streptomyces sp. 13-12-16]|uniref:ATP-dependent nuclease n=1 Tax=Streptomyces sp. 13-12-16 TaxID=1570823 RepID=UPI000A1F7A57|nr:AAA family ATPase [Streptomyces sp. 13-12-16]OSP44758.1 ATP-dependent endonuclease [Streptomyces sp. 13-12-16]
MKIKRVRIENFCCLRSLDVSFDSITSLIGPTGVGKSTVLRALDWFFNGEKGGSLGEEDVHSAAETKRIRVEVEFDGLTASDRAALGHYAPDGLETLSIWRTWENGEDRITGKALAYPPFERIREGAGSREKTAAYKALREQDPALGLPAVRGWDAAEAEMRSWEARNRDRLTEAEVEGTHFFGFAGQGLLGKLIDFVFISADLRAYEETDDNKASVVGRILEHAVDRSEAEAHFTAIDEEAQAAREKVHREIYAPVLARLSGALSAEVGRFTVGRDVVVTPTAQVPKRARTAFAVSIRDGAALTPVRRQGHGFQRALIIAALTYLSECRRPESGTRSLCLAIEEPELFQHPAQTRVFAQVLRSLVATAGDRTQVMYATHSPVFIDPSHYQQVRRLYRVTGGEHPDVGLRTLGEEQLRTALDGHVDERSIARRGTTRYVKDLAEALFSDVAVLVEGVTDEAVLLAFAERQGRNLGAEGICVLSTEGKNNMMLCHAILTGFGVRCYLVFDADTGPQRGQGGVNPQHEAENMRILGYLGVPVVPRPATASETEYTVFEDDLETCLRDEWPAWSARCRELTKLEAGYVAGKHVPTYAEAARTADGEPKLLHALLENVRAMAGQPTPRA